jgi:urease accessory protein UreF
MQQMLNQIRLSAAVTCPEPGTVSALLEQLGSMEELVNITAAGALLQSASITNLQELAVFIETYFEQLLVPLELPLIYKSWHHATHHQCRELIALDHSIAEQIVLPQFAAASQRVGRIHLNAMGSMRGERLVQRYLAAVEAGEAHGWHTVVYGITLALYSLPVRQGLMHYAYRTMGGFVQAAAKSLDLTQRDCRDIVLAACEDLPQAIEVTLTPTV